MEDEWRNWIKKGGRRSEGGAVGGQSTTITSRMEVTVFADRQWEVLEIITQKLVASNSF